MFPPLYYLLDEKTRALQEVFEKGIDIRLCYIYLHQKQNGLREQSVFVFAEDYTEPSHTELCESTAPGFAQEKAGEE